MATKIVAPSLRGAHAALPAMDEDEAVSSGY